MGRPQFQRGVDVGVFTAESYEMYSSSPDTTLIPGAANLWTILPAVGNVAVLQQFRFEMPGVAASAGTHEIYAHITTASKVIRMLYAVAPGNQALTLDCWGYTVAPTTQKPTSEATLIAAMKGLTWDRTDYLQVYYTWNGTVDQVGVARTLTVGYQLRKVAN